jgi:hypothetical protein
MQYAQGTLQSKELRRKSMSFQAYLDNLEQKTGKTPEELLAIAKEKGFNANSKAGDVVAWLAEDYDVGRGHAMALYYVLKNGTTISEKHVGTDGVHRDESVTLRIDGVDKR